MKRKQFLDQLNRISYLNNQLSNMYDAPMLCCKQYQIKQRNANSSFRTNTQSSQPKIFVKPRVVSCWQERSRPNSANSPKTFKNALKTEPSSFQKKDPSESDKNINKINRAIVIKSQISEQMNKEVIPYTDKKYVRQITIPRRINHTSMTTNQTKVQRQSSQRMSTNYSSVQIDPKSGRKYNTHSNLMFKQQSKKTSVQQYSSLRNKVPDLKNLDKLSKLAIRKQINKNYRKPFNPPPKLTSKSYIIYQCQTNNHQSSVITSFNSKSCQQVASLTKIMTCIVVIQFSQQNNIDIACQDVLVGNMESKIGGTSASIKKGQIYTVQQLLYGLMLPSGNDASLALAVWTGKKLLKKDQQQNLSKNVILPKKDSLSEKLRQTGVSQQSSSPHKVLTKKQCYNRFIIEMNSKAKSLKMSKTNYANSHGLINTNNRSSAYDIAILSQYALKNDLFRKVVSTQSYQSFIRVKSDKFSQKQQFSSDQQAQDEEIAQSYAPNNVKNVNIQIKHKKIPVKWTNTQKLLKHKQYIGIKTGYTTAAGPCLASCLSVQGRQFIIVVLSCCRMSMRFRQTQILRKWLYKHQGIKKPKKFQQKSECEQSDYQEYPISPTICSDMMQNQD